MPLPDPVAEGIRIISNARVRSLEVYLLGGIAIAARRPSRIRPLVERPFNDIDVITSRSAGREITRLLASLDYQADHEFNAVNGRTRMLFRDMSNDRDLDVLIGEFAMCHELPVLDNVTLDEITIPLADLLLTKLQIVQLNQKDIWDAYNLLYAHDVCEGPESRDSIDTARIANLCARDWGLWNTVTGNLAQLTAPPHESALPGHARTTVRDRVEALQSAIAVVKKSRRWSLRSRVGERVRWYEEPEEAH